MAQHACRNYPVIPEFNQTPPAFNGAKLRIRPYFTTRTMDDIKSEFNSGLQLVMAAKILEKHTLMLDQAALSLIPFTDPIISGINRDHAQDFFKIRSLVPNDPEDSLIVIFHFVESEEYGECVCVPDWLPFIVVHPFADDLRVLAHEIGHASRCAHVAGSIMEACGAYGTPYDNFENIHAYELYRSYWCTGPRPDNWWEAGQFNLNSSAYGPYAWPPYDRPS